MKPVNLRECQAAEMRPAPSPLVRNCKILGLTSRNGRRYQPEALRRAVPKYEGAAVYFDHATSQASKEPRSFLAKFGRLSNVRYVEGDGLRGDFHYNARHLYAETFRGWLETDPQAVGFSHTATGRVREGEDGIDIVEEITDVESVDLVATPATTAGLFESHLYECPMDPLIPKADAADASAGETYEAHLGKLVASILNDTSLDLGSKRKKILAALKLLDDGATPPDETLETDEEPGAVDEEEDEDAVDDVRAEEAVRRMKSTAVKRLLRQLDEVRAKIRLDTLRSRAKALCEQHGLPGPTVTELFLAVLVESGDEARMVKLIKDRKAVMVGAGRPIALASGAERAPTVDDLVKSLFEVR
jgi:hypothetical protein